MLKKIGSGVAMAAAVVTVAVGITIFATVAYKGNKVTDLRAENAQLKDELKKIKSDIPDNNKIATLESKLFDLKIALEKSETIVQNQNAEIATLKKLIAEGKLVANNETSLRASSNEASISSENRAPQDYSNIKYEFDGFIVSVTNVVVNNDRSTIKVGTIFENVTNRKIYIAKLNRAHNITTEQLDDFRSPLLDLKGVPSADGLNASKKENYAFIEAKTKIPFVWELRLEQNSIPANGNLLTISQGMMMFTSAGPKEFNVLLRDIPVGSQ